MPILRVHDIIDRFKSAFEDDVLKPSVPQNATFISNFCTSLKKVIASLGNLSKMSLKLA